MSEMVRALVKQRLAAAAEEIFGLFERTIAEHEEERCRLKEEIDRQNKLLDAVLKPEIRLHRADAHQLLVVKEEEPPEPPHIKEEDDEEKAQSSQLHQTLTEHMEPAADGEDCGGPEPARNSHPDPHLQPETEDQPEDSSETEDSVDYSSDSDKTRKTGENQFSCSHRGKIFRLNSGLKSHMRIHTGEKPFSCSVCSKTFNIKGTLTNHMVLHTGKKPFSCSICLKTFSQKSHLTDHMVVHTGDKPFSCSVCSKTFNIKGNLTKHMVLHTGEKPFSCSVCNKTFTQKVNLTTHMFVHTGEKQFSCKVCEQRFRWNKSLRRHEAVCLQSSQLHQNQTEENREAEPGASSSTEHMEPAADGEDCGGPEPARNSHPDLHLQHETEDQSEDSSKTEDRQLQPYPKKRFSCSECGERFLQKSTLKRHMKIHMGKKP